MMKVSKANVEHVSGSSTYVAELTGNVEDIVDNIRPLVEQKKYFRNFYDKAAR